MTRFACGLGWGSGALALAMASIAHAGGGSSSGTGSSDTGASESGTSGDTSSAGGTDTGTTDTGTTDTGTGTDSSTTEPCGTCEQQPGDTVFESPTDGAAVDSPFEVQVSVVQRVGCDCTEQAPMFVELYVDDVPLGEPCYELSCTWTVDAMIGSHSLYAGATYAEDDYVGTTIHAYVQSAATGSGPDYGSSSSEGPVSDETTTTGAAAEPKESGCSCMTSAAPTDAAWLVAIAFFARRRRVRARGA